eukprot:10100426-Alexandrium_andersonii.AAC.1
MSGILSVAARGAPAHTADTSGSATSAEPKLWSRTFRAGWGCSLLHKYSLGTCSRLANESFGAVSA